jgi:ribonuclease HI
MARYCSGPSVLAGVRAANKRSETGMSYNKENFGCQILAADGACIPNPGVMGIAVAGDCLRVIPSIFLGGGTNQAAELLAIELAIEFARPGTRILTDSQYVYAVINGEWNYIEHAALIETIQRSLGASGACLQWVKRCTHPLHSLADHWANRAAKKRESVLVRSEFDHQNGRSNRGLTDHRLEVVTPIDVSGMEAASIAAEAMRFQNEILSAAKPIRADAGSLGGEVREIKQRSRVARLRSGSSVKDSNR